MSKILEIKMFNNGYGCSCCRKDWEENTWINEDEMIDFKTLLTETIKELSKGVCQGGCVSIVYEKDGQILYGIEPNIYRVGYEFYAVFGSDADLDCEKELLIKGYEGVSRDRSYSVDEILEMYQVER